MGDPKFPRRRFATPFHPWKADRIAEENALQHKYGLKNKKEVWRTKSHLREFRGQARDLLARSRAGEPQAVKETQQLLRKLSRLGVLPETATLDDVLGLNIENVLARRLQTQVYLRGFTASMGQARQFINHGHVSVGESRMNVPGYYLKRGEENTVKLVEGHAVASDSHPVRPRRAEGAGPPKLQEWKPKTVESMRRGPPRGGGPRPMPMATPRSAPAAPGAAPAAAAGDRPAGREDPRRRKPSNEPRTQGGGAF